MSACVLMSFNFRVLGLQQMVDMDTACAGLLDDLVAYANAADPHIKV